MTALTWTPDLSLQQPRMDDTHREFVDLLNAVEHALDQSHEALACSLEDFIAHTEAHFGQEERWMADLGFAAQNCHAANHAQVLEVLREVRRRHRDTSDVAVVRAMVPALAEWFPGHAQSMDAALAMTMAEHGFDPEAPLRARVVRAEPITGCGSVACSS